MELTRVLHPVGQGGFYTETIKNENGNEFNVVYDCGGNGQKFMKNYLNSCFTKPKTFDLVFISHFHYDHINGLLSLLKNYNVKHLIIPQLTKDILLESVLYNYLNYGSYDNLVNRFLQNIYNQENYGETQITQILPYNENNNVVTEEYPLTDGFITQNNGFRTDLQKDMLSGTVFSFGKWFYVPFNPPVPKKDKIKGGFYDFIKDNLNGGKDFNISSDLSKIVGQDLKKCVVLYEQFFKSGNNHNAYSMTLFSGMRKPEEHCHLVNSFDIYYRYLNYRVCFNNPNFLYTGDFEPDNKYANNVKIMKGFYGQLWNSFESIQVPHHGSRNNFSKELYEGKSVGYISAGELNKFNHPDKDTLLDIIDCDCVPVIVSDNVSTIIISKYHIYI